MEPNITPLERAFQLAQSGHYATVAEIKLRLHREGYRYEVVEGPLLRKQLADAMAKARGICEDIVLKPGRKAHSSARS